MPILNSNHYYSRRALAGLFAGAAVCAASDPGPKEPSPQTRPLKFGLRAEYFNLDPLQRVPQLPDRAPEVERIDHQLVFDWTRRGPLGPRGAIGPRNFGVRWTGFLRIPGPGMATFVLAHRGGVRWLLSGETLYDSWMRINPSGVFIPKQFDQTGWYPLQLEFHSSRGRSTIQLEWALPGSAKRTPIPASNFAHLPTVTSISQPKDNPSISNPIPSGSFPRPSGKGLHHCPSPEVVSNPNRPPGQLDRGPSSRPHDVR